MRLVTRGDLDSLTCSVLLSLHETIGEIHLVHPQDLAEGAVEIGPDDILANLPYQPGCAMWFDHHQHTATVAAPVEEFRGAFGYAPSAARLVYDYYGGEEAMPQLADLVHETDRLDSADLTPEDVMAPGGYVQLGFTLDSRSGLGPLDDYFHTLVRTIVGLVRLGDPVAEVLAHPEVEKRCRQLKDTDDSFCEVLGGHSEVDGNVVVTDFRDLAEVPVGNRFLVYALYPEVNVSMRLQWGRQGSFQMMTLGHSIFTRTCQTNLGELAARYGGGGHPGAASIPLMEDPDQQIQMILGELKAKG